MQVASLQLAITHRYARSLICQYPHALIPQLGERRHCRFLQAVRSWPDPAVSFICSPMKV
jgi:hypothetical protein